MSEKTTNIDVDLDRIWVKPKPGSAADPEGGKLIIKCGDTALTKVLQFTEG